VPERMSCRVARTPSSMRARTRQRNADRTGALVDPAIQDAAALAYDDPPS
jgi:hypothetical protein